MKHRPILSVAVAILSLAFPACKHGDDEAHEAEQEIILTTPIIKDVVFTQPYVCQIHSQKHIDVRALEEGYLEKIDVTEGKHVKADDVLFRVIPPIYKARIAAEEAEAAFAQVEYNNTMQLNAKKVVSDQEVALYKARLNRALARLELAKQEMQFTEVKAYFDGVMDRLYKQQGSLVSKGDLLTTLSDNSKMWVYFNVPEARYLNYVNKQLDRKDVSKLTLIDSRIELMLANHKIFNHEASNVVTVEGKFNNMTGNIAFRADFPNPELVLRHGQTGTVMIREAVKNALVIPQRASFEILDKRYVWVVEEEVDPETNEKKKVTKQRYITLAYELEDEFVIESGLKVTDTIVLEGVRQVKQGFELEEGVKTISAKDALAHQKNHAE